MTNSIWFLKGLRKGIITEKFPIAGPAEPPLWPSMLSGNGDADCPTKAIENARIFDIEGDTNSTCFIIPLSILT